jgi:GDP-L-fucose synthase
MVGSAVARHLEMRGDAVIRVDRSVVDLQTRLAVDVWLRQCRPDAIVFDAARVGGI